MRRLILVGKGGSGKDYARKILEDKGFRYCISHTTRPPREGEVNGRDYNFISRDSAAHHYIPRDLFYEYVIFNNWLYGTTKEEFERSNLFIMTPSGISKLLPNDRLESFIVYFDIDIDTRRRRLNERGDIDVIERRLEADDLDFENFTNFDYRIVDPEFIINGDWADVGRYKIKKLQ
jgi:guanylate kinase